jgi:peptide deformylase
LGGEQIPNEEGCLSFPEIFADVSRSKKVFVKTLNIEGKEIQIEADGILARALQHEIDHLNGVLFIDHINYVKKLLLKKKLEGLKRANGRE